MHSEPATHEQAGRGSPKSYLTGFALSVVLTVIPFALAMHPNVSRGAIIVSILVLAVAQILVHLVYFLHLDRSSQQRWNVIAFVFTVLIVAILIGGSIWIMVNIAHNMMGP